MWGMVCLPGTRHYRNIGWFICKYHMHSVASIMRVSCFMINAMPYLGHTLSLSLFAIVFSCAVRLAIAMCHYQIGLVIVASSEEHDHISRSD